MENSKAKKDQSFRIDDLLNGKISKDNFQIDYLPMFKMLDDTDRRLANRGGLASLKTEDIWKRIYDFGVITVSLDKADMQTRIDELNEQNLKWFVKADTLETENTTLRNQLAELKAKNDVKEFTLQEQPRAEGIEVSTETNQETETNPQ